ncbi:MAG: hypothetical protein E7254_01805 [Lachnospiraceae bacterium]|nr:hypothetical protein [Lachnospiraceae bacterium]
MGLFFKNKSEDELDNILSSIHMNMANNYKDAAQKDLIKFEEQLSDIINAGKISTRKIGYYQKILDDLKIQLKGYTHKDQKPNW